jgi:glycosyltransferase involved in cell wall biosynthesis
MISSGQNLVSVVIPVFNEESEVGRCLQSLKKQSLKNLEIILVDDGSTDKTPDVINKLKSEFKNLILLKQNHQGPGPARNLGASRAKGEILVFVDSDMTFEKDFIKDLTLPIRKKQAVGTFSKNEMNANKDNIWSKCWNINRGWPADRLIPPDYPSQAPVYRAILKSQFEKVRGFDATGEYTDDWSLSRKLGIKSTLAKGAIYYHKNPATLKEVWKQARWIGKNEFISGSWLRRTKSLIFYSFPISFLVAVFKLTVKRTPQFLIFKIWYDFAVWVSVIKAFFKEPKSK